MIYSVLLEAKGDAEELHRCFMPERRLREDRAALGIKKQKGKLVFRIEAKDSVALRATLNSITKLFTVYEKMKAVKNGNGEGNRAEDK